MLRNPYSYFPKLIKNSFLSFFSKPRSHQSSYVAFLNLEQPPYILSFPLPPSLPHTHCYTLFLPYTEDTDLLKSPVNCLVYFLTFWVICYFFKMTSSYFLQLEVSSVRQKCNMDCIYNFKSSHKRVKNKQVNTFLNTFYIPHTRLGQFQFSVATCGQ